MGIKEISSSSNSDHSYFFTKVHSGINHYEERFIRDLLRSYVRRYGNKREVTLKPMPLSTNPSVSLDGFDIYGVGDLSIKCHGCLF